MSLRWGRHPVPTSAGTDRQEPPVSDLLVSIIRTLIPAIVAWLLAAAARVGLDVPADQLAGVIEAVVLGVYYAAVRTAEQRWPAVGWLLGLPRPPAYDADREPRP